jgi:hypothetical protein
MRITLLVLILVAAPSIAFACEESGAPIYKETRTPLGDTIGGAIEEIVVHASGAWHTASVIGERDGPGDAGCLTRKRLAEVKLALKKARWKQSPNHPCDAVSDVAIVHEAPSRKKIAYSEVPCGRSLDRTTERAAACVAAALDASVSVKQLRAVCRRK